MDAPLITTDLFSLKNKKIFLTGGTGHLGKSMAVGLGLMGAHLILHVRSDEKKKNLCDYLGQLGISCEFTDFDLLDELAIQNFFKNYVDPINCIINNAYEGSLGTLENSSANEYLKSFNVGVVTAHNILKYAVSNLREAVEIHGDASVINIASMYGMVSPDFRNYPSSDKVNPPFYGAAKAALIQLSKYAACELGVHGIRVNSISPGPFPSESTQKLDPDFVFRLSQKTPLFRIGKSQEIVGPVVFLASAASTYITGSNVVVDGGWTIW